MDTSEVSGRFQASQTDGHSDEIPRPQAAKRYGDDHGGDVVSTGSSTQVTRRGVFPRLRDTRIRAKLALILVVPLVAVVALAGVRLVDVGQQATAAGQVQKLTKLGTDISELAQLLHAE